MLKRYRSCNGLMALLLLVLSVISPLGMSRFANAAGDYGLKTARSLHLGGEGLGANQRCSMVDMSANWSTIADEPSASTPYSYKNAYGYSSDHNNNTAMDQFFSDFHARLESGHGWGVAQTSEFRNRVNTAADFDTVQGAISIYIFDDDATFTLTNNKLAPSKGGIRYIDFFLNPNANCRYQAYDPTIQGNIVQAPSSLNGNGVLMVKLFLWSTIMINYPADYSGVQIPASAPAARNYVALGDSFSSGEGLSSFEAGTDIGGTNECHRSSDAYPSLLTTRMYVNLTNFVACSGATTDNIINNGQWNEAPQIDALSQDTDIVTLTIGGNDVGFRNFATACTISLCDFSTQAYDDIHNSILNDLPGKLAGTLQAIDGETSNSAKIYVIGYPNLAPSVMPTGPSSACWPLNGNVNNSDPTHNNGAAVYAIQTQLNDAIHTAMTNYGSSKFQYIDPNEDNSPFTGHDWCKQDRFFDVVSLPLPGDPGRTVSSYHPNTLGQSAYATVVSEAVQDN